MQCYHACDCIFSIIHQCWKAVESTTGISLDPSLLQNRAHHNDNPWREFSFDFIARDDFIVRHASYAVIESNGKFPGTSRILASISRDERWMVVRIPAILVRFYVIVILKELMKYSVHSLQLLNRFKFESKYSSR